MTFDPLNFCSWSITQSKLHLLPWLIFSSSLVSCWHSSFGFWVFFCANFSSWEEKGKEMQQFASTVLFYCLQILYISTMGADEWKFMARTKKINMNMWIRVVMMNVYLLHEYHNGLLMWNSYNIVEKFWSTPHFVIFGFQGDRLSCKFFKRYGAIILQTLWSSFNVFFYISCFSTCLQSKPYKKKVIQRKFLKRGLKTIYSWWAVSEIL